MASLILFAGCTGTTVIHSKPEGARLYVDGEPVGKTPYTYYDTKIVGSSTHLRLEMDGYEEYNAVMVRNEEADVGAIIGGIFFLVPFLWTMKYKPSHTYELKPVSHDPGTGNPVAPDKKVDPVSGPSKSKAERLRDLKGLLDDEIITQEEFEKEKAKILAEDE